MWIIIWILKISRVLEKEILVSLISSALLTSTAAWLKHE